MSTSEPTSFPKVNPARHLRDRAIRDTASDLGIRVWELVEAHGLSSQELHMALAILNESIARDVLSDVRDQGDQGPL
jgi:hypothetical protein